MHLPNFDSFDAEDVSLILESMPDAMAPVVNSLWLKTTFTLIKVFAGQVFVVPKRPRGAGVARFLLIEGAIGIHAALELSKHFGGEKLSVPRMAVLMRKLRNRELIRVFDAALAVMSAANAANELATQYELTCRQVEMIVSGKSGSSSYKKGSDKGCAPKSQAVSSIS